MAAKARKGHYHDFLSEHPTPDLLLLADLRDAAKLAADRTKIDELIHRHSNGEFDASTEESEEWAMSPDGQQAMRNLLK
jgi:hypothetical protein